MPTKKPSSSGSSRPAGTQKKYGSLTRSINGDKAQFAECLAGQLGAAIDLVINDGDLLSLSRTSDGGAICIFIKSGDEVVHKYCVVQAELDEAIALLSAGM